MVRSLLDEVDDEMKHREGTMVCKQVSIATGKLAGPILEECAEKITEKYPNISIQVHVIRNDFFGEDITVAGLITGQDLINQLKAQELGEYLILPGTMLRSGEEVFLDDYTLDDLKKTLQIPIRIVESDGMSLVNAVVEDEYE